jgi:hypothetical protein
MGQYKKLSNRIMKSINFYYPAIFNQNAIYLIVYNPLCVIKNELYEN